MLDIRIMNESHYLNLKSQTFFHANKRFETLLSDLFAVR